MTPLLGRSYSQFFSLLTGSYLKLTGESIVPESCGETTGVMDWLYRYAPYGVLAQNASMEPRFVYANRTAQSFFECNWNEIVGMHSRLSAPETNQEARASVMEDVMRKGYRAGYRGVRRTLAGRLFWIDNVTIWNMVDDEDIVHGQAAVIRRTIPILAEQSGPAAILETARSAFGT